MIKTTISIAMTLLLLSCHAPVHEDTMHRLRYDSQILKLEKKLGNIEAQLKNIAYAIPQDFIYHDDTYFLADNENEDQFSYVIKKYNPSRFYKIKDHDFGKYYNFRNLHLKYMDIYSKYKTAKREQSLKDRHSW